MMMTVASCPLARSAVHSSMPVMPPMRTSASTKSGSNVDTRVSASSALATASTS